MSDQKILPPLEQRDYAKYYILFSAILFLGTMWSVFDEVWARRPWKHDQQRYYELAAAKLDSLKHAALSEVDSARVSELQQNVSQAAVGLQSAEYAKAVGQKENLSKDLVIADREWRFARSRSDAAYYQFQRATIEGRKADAPSYRKEVDKQEADVKKYFDEKADLESKIAGLDLTINKYKDAYQKAQVALNNVYAKANAYGTKAQKISIAPVAIRQVILPDFELTPFQEIKARVDRCQTCHAGWNDDTMEDAPQPFKKHPVPELLAKHNPETFGCTPCHRGQGPALTAGFAHGDKDKYWETPILRDADVYATCNSCHYNETVLKSAKPLVKAKQIIVDSGCYGCHEIKGYTDLAKIAPQLNAVLSKTTPDWVFRWVRNPKEYNPHTRMPNFRLNDEQAEAITAYLVSLTKQSGFKPLSPRGAYSGGIASEGKKIFETVGCQACHTLGNFTAVRDSRGTSYDIAPELTRVGSKVNSDWMFDWIRNPRHYNPETRMPSLRLTDAEARNVVAYLMTQKDERSLTPVKLALDDPRKIERGAKVIREYGCFGCHEIKGMENEGKVSVELSDFGRKKYDQMDFGNTKELPADSAGDYRENPDGSISVRHSWAGWVYGKLTNPRLYQTERIIQKMPVFAFNGGEIRLIRMFLTSMTKEVPLASYAQPYDKRMQDIEVGRRLTMKYNCIQCHQLEDRGGYMLAKYEEAALGPPMLPESQGAKVQEPWLHSFLKNPSTIRIWLKVRMPTFSLTDDEIGKIQRYFLGLAKQDFVIRDYASTPVEEKYLIPGKKLYDEYQCAKCHPAGSKIEAVSADLAPDLAKANSRLKPEWILDWLKDPGKLQPGTRMPTFFTEGQQAPDPLILGGANEEQIKALKTYVWSLGRRAGPVASK